MNNLKNKIDNAAGKAKDAATKAGKGVKQSSAKVAGKLKKAGRRAGNKMGA